jgi:hypothetical protein
MKIKIGDKFIRGTRTYEVIGLKPGGKVELFCKDNSRFVDSWTYLMRDWEMA